MLFAFGPRHPRTYRRGRCRSTARRLWLALFAVVMFILCFTPAPIEPLDIVTAPQAFGDVRDVRLQHAQRIDVDGDAAPHLRHRGEHRLQRLAHLGASGALEEELHAMLAAQPRQRRRRRTEDR